MNEILKNIRGYRIREIIKILLATIFLGSVPFLSIICGFIVPVLIEKNEIEVFSIVSLVFGIITLFIPWLCVKAFIENISIAINPTKDEVFRKYGSPEKIERIIKDIHLKNVYKDNKIMISDQFLYDGSNYASIIAIKDITNITKTVNKVNFAIDHYTISIHDKYGITLNCVYSRTEEELVNKIITLINTLKNKK